MEVKIKHRITKISEFDEQFIPEIVSARCLNSVYKLPYINHVRAPTPSFHFYFSTFRREIYGNFWNIKTARECLQQQLERDGWGASRCGENGLTCFSTHRRFVFISHSKLIVPGVYITLRLNIYLQDI